MDSLSRSITGDPRKAVRLGIGKTVKRGGNCGMIGRATSANPVGLVTVARRQPLRHQFRGNLDQHGQIRQQPAAADAVGSGFDTADQES